MITAESHNAGLCGKVEILRPGHPVLPSLPDVETLNYRWYRGKAGFDRDEGYLSLVRSYGCIVCDARGPSEPHHIGASMGPLKVSDYSTIPVCRGCHEKFESSNDVKLRGVYYLALFHVRVMRDAHA